LLRHHRERGLRNKEIWQRDYFDYLLAYYAILEIALLIEFVDAIPVQDRNRALRQLSQTGIRKYYEENYPLELPARLRKRLQGLETSRIKDKDGRLTAIFLEFAALTAYFETDEDLEVFLWFLEAGGRDSYWYKDLLRVLASSKLLMASMTKDPDEKTALDQSVEGFGKFLEFCVQLDALLAACEASKPLQSALFLYYAYWFKRLRKIMGSQVSAALKKYAEADSEKEQGFVARAREAIDRLLAGTYDDVSRTDMGTSGNRMNSSKSK